MPDFFHNPDDRDNLDRILGEGRVGDVILAELETWTKMIHRAGSTGPIGPVALTALCRSLGLGPPETPAPAVITDWSMIEPGTRIEAKFAGSWHPGFFDGPVAMGSWGVRLDGDEHRVLETSAFYLRLEGAGAPREPVCDIVSQNDPEPPAPETVVPPPVPVKEEQGLAFADNWAEVEAGAELWLQDGDDVKDAKFVRQTESGLLVQVAGEDAPREVAQEAVMLDR